MCTKPGVIVLPLWAKVLNYELPVPRLSTEENNCTESLNGEATIDKTGFVQRTIVVWSAASKRCLQFVGNKLGWMLYPGVRLSVKVCYLSHWE